MIYFKNFETLRKQEGRQSAFNERALHLYLSQSTPNFRFENRDYFVNLWTLHKTFKNFGLNKLGAVATCYDNITLF